MIETRTITRTLCPVELKLPIPAEVPVPDGAIVRGNQLGMEHIARRFSREELLAARLADAAAECVVPQDAGASLGRQPRQEEPHRVQRLAGRRARHP